MSQIRLAKISDANGIAMVHVASWRETYNGLLPAAILANLSLTARITGWQKLLDQRSCTSGAAYVAERDGAIVGFAHASEQRTTSLKQAGFTGEISSIYVLRAYQRQGIGTALMKSVAGMLINSGHAAATLWVLRRNLDARIFYETLKGEPVCEREDKREATTLVEVAYGWRDLHLLL